MSPAGLKEVKWVWEGDGKSSVRVMPEAKLGKYERLLLQKDEGIAVQIEFTNNAWHWFKKVTPPPTHGKTFPL